MALDGRFGLIQTPQALPGNCTGCGRATDKLGFIDTDLQFDYHGAVIFCSECVFDMASKFGFITPAVADVFKDQIAKLETETTNLRAAVLGLEQTVDGLLAIRDSGVNSIVIPTISAESEVPKQTTEEIPADFLGTISEDSDTTITTGESEVNDDHSEQIPVGVSSSISSDLPELDF